MVKLRALALLLVSGLRGSAPLAATVKPGDFITKDNASR